jgi:putative Holliday junction resolvase
VEEGRFLGLDVGEARTGIAVSDPLGILASPLKTLQVKSLGEDAAAIARIAKEQEAIRIVVGLPLNKEGGIGPQAKKVLAFVEALRAATPVEVVTIDERFSTAAAHRALDETGVRSKKRKGVIDQAAAQQILQLYLDRERTRRGRGE